MDIKEKFKNMFMLQKAKKILFVFLISIGTLGLIFYGFSKYGEWSLQRDIKNIVEAQNRPYFEDTYGGKTPKETLDLFITAVEKGDFTLASKYFVLSEQKKWEDRLIGGEKEKLNNWIGLLKSAQGRESLWEGNFQMEVKNKGDEIGLIIDFIKYPSGVWKIQEL